MSQETWDQYFLGIAQLVSLKSKDRSTKVGAVIVGPDNEIRSTGYNGFPRGLNDEAEHRHERPAKYMYTEHAERNAIFNAAMHGIPLKGCTMYINFSLFPCTDCTRALIQSGIVAVVGVKGKEFSGKGNHWLDNFKTAKEIFDEVGIVYREV